MTSLLYVDRAQLVSMQNSAATVCSEGDVWTLLVSYGRAYAPTMTFVTRVIVFPPLAM